MNYLSQVSKGHPESPKADIFIYSTGFESAQTTELLSMNAVIPSHLVRVSGERISSTLADITMSSLLR